MAALLAAVLLAGPAAAGRCGELRAAGGAWRELADGALRVELCSPTRDSPLEPLAHQLPPSLDALAQVLGPLPGAHLEVVLEGSAGSLLGSASPGSVTVGFGPSPSEQQWAVLHELAHQWLGAVPAQGVEARAEAEALAQFVALLALERLAGPQAAASRLQGWSRTWGLYRLLGGADGPARLTALLGPAAGALVYSKAPIGLVRQRALVGAQTFDGALRAASLEAGETAVTLSAVKARLRTQVNARTAVELDALEQRFFDGAYGDEDLGAPQPRDFLDGSVPLTPEQRARVQAQAARAASPVAGTAPVVQAPPRRCGCGVVTPPEVAVAAAWLWLAAHRRARRRRPCSLPPGPAASFRELGAPGRESQSRGGRGAPQRRHP